MMGEDQIRANAQSVLNPLSSLSQPEVRFGYNRESVQWVEEFIEQQRRAADVTPESTANLVRIIGSYLGECVIHTYGGEWRQHEGEWGVFFDNSNAVFPFAKVRKQFENGLAGGDSILGFFEIIGPVFLNKI